jgi:hypothetical protein
MRFFLSGNNHRLNNEYRTGINNNVIIVETIKPPITLKLNGTQTSEPSPVESAIGIIPKMVVSVVERTGLSRLSPA